MSRRATALPRLLVLLAALALGALASAPASDASVTPWGDLGHFGERESELKAPEPAFGVDPEDGSVWVVDQTGESGSEELRLQKFVKSGGTWSVVASHVLESAEAPKESTREVEGVAFDTKEKRAYVLVNQERVSGKLAEEQAASELWAFSTETKEGKIEPASGTKEGVLVPANESPSITGTPVGKKEFAPDAKEKGASLISPSGIAVNPTNDEVLITGWIGSEENKASQLWAVSDTGEIKTVWEDKTKYFEGCGCVTSPAVTSAGNIYVLGEEQEVVELPSTLASATAPKQAFFFPHFKECEIEKKQPCSYIEKVAFIETGVEELGGEMTIGPEGNIYVHLEIRNASEGNFTDGGVLVLSPTLQEIGWTGGGSWSSATKECAVNEKDTGNFGPSLVGAFDEHVFMFERGQPLDGEHAKVLELGPGGKAGNCPQGTTTKPAAEAGGVALTSFPIADNVRFSSELKQANAVTTEWEFGDGGTTQTVEKRQQEKTLVEHQFKKEGSLEVKEKIHTDDLATPLLETSEKITVVAPKIKAEGATPEATTEATLKGEVNPMLSPTKCEFQLVEAGKAFSDSSAKKIACPKAPGEEEKWVTESTKVTGLTGGTCYVFRLLAKAGAWESGQAGTEFKAGGGVCSGVSGPVVEAKPATEVTATSATLNGSVNPKGVETKSCTFEYGTALPSGKTAPCSPKPGKGESPEAVSAKVMSLTGATTYKFKLIDESTESKKSEGEGSFKTSAAAEAPGVEELTPASITQTTATLKANVNPHGETTTCQFEYGTTTSYGTTVACPTPPGSGSANVEEALPVSGLTASTTYHFRVTAKNGTGTTPGADKEFSTEATVAPVAETKAATEVTGASATLNGSVNPKGVETKSCTFEYGTALPSGKTAACSPAPGNGSAPVSVSASVTGLTAGTAYKFKLVDESTESKKAEGAALSFTTGSAPSVEDLAAASVTQTTATLKADVNPRGEASTCQFEYGTTTSYGTTVACPTSPGSGTGNVEESLPVSGLSPSTTYHFRLTAKNNTGTTNGADKELKTEAPAAPSVEDLTPVSVTQTTATLKATVNPHGEATTCKFEYGTTTGYGTTVACPTPPGAGSSGVEESLPVAGLSAGTTYHFRVTAENKATTQGADREFKTQAASSTPPPPPPPPPPSEEGKGGVEHLVVSNVPNVTVKGSAMSVTASGAFALSLSCPSGETTCAGTVTVKTQSAIPASLARVAAAKKVILTLATGSFTIAGGKLKLVSLHLNAKARKLLAKTHSIRARVTIVAHDPQGHTHTTTAIVTLKPAKKKH